MKSGLTVFGAAIVWVVVMAVAVFAAAMVAVFSVLLPLLVIGALVAVIIACAKACDRRRAAAAYDAEYWCWYHYEYTPDVYSYYWRQLPVAAAAASSGLRQRRQHSAVAAGALRHGAPR